MTLNLPHKVQKSFLSKSKIKWNWVHFVQNDVTVDDVKQERGENKPDKELLILEYPVKSASQASYELKIKCSW